MWTHPSAILYFFIGFSVDSGEGYIYLIYEIFKGHKTLKEYVEGKPVYCAIGSCFRFANSGSDNERLQKVQP